MSEAYKSSLKQAVKEAGAFNLEMRARWNFYLTQKHPIETAILTKYGVYGHEAHVAGWANVGAHCLAEAAAGNVLMRALGLEADVLEKALIIHDYNKRSDKEARPKGMTPYQAGAWTAEREYGDGNLLLGKFGISAEVEKLSHSNILRKFHPLAIFKILDRPIEEKIAHYLDIVFTGEMITDPKLRLLLVEQGAEFQGFSEWFMPKYDGIGIGPVQQIVVALTTIELEDKLNLMSGTLPTWINHQIDLGPDADIHFGEFKES